MGGPEPTKDPAIESLRAALAISPDDVTLRRLLAERLTTRGLHEEALEHWAAAVHLSPEDLGLRLALAESLLAAGRFAAAELAADDLLASEPSVPAALLVRVRALEWQGKLVEAREAYRSAIRLDSALEDDRLAVHLGLTAAGDENPAGMEPTSAAPFEDAGRSSLDGVEILERVRVTFADVGGMDSLKEQIRLKILYPQQHPDLYQAYGKRAGGGLLLYGPPGCGKTHLARATAGELSAAFISVGIADVLEMWIGESERNLSRIFAVARSHTPCVLFFDEIDALAASRNDFKAASGRALVNQFLAELDGIDGSNEGILVIGATNAPWHMDTAFRRPGRFAQIVFVPPPDLDARKAILEVLLRGRPTRDVDIERMASATEGYSRGRSDGAR